MYYYILLLYRAQRPNDLFRAASIECVNTHYMRYRSKAEAITKAIQLNEALAPEVIAVSCWQVVELPF